jgi:hypothetical protein
MMAKRHPVRNSQFIKAIRDVHSFFLSRRKLQNKKKSACINPVCLNFPLEYEHRKYVENRF